MPDFRVADTAAEHPTLRAADLAVFGAVMSTAAAVLPRARKAGRMSWEATGWAIAQRTGGARRKGLLMVLAEHADPDGLCQPGPSTRTLAAEAECDQRTVRDLLAGLAAAGLLSWTPGGGRRAHVYQLSMPSSSVQGGSRRRRPAGGVSSPPSSAGVSSPAADPEVSRPSEAPAGAGSHTAPVGRSEGSGPSLRDPGKGRSEGRTPSLRDDEDDRSEGPEPRSEGILVRSEESHLSDQHKREPLNRTEEPITTRAAAAPPPPARARGRGGSRVREHVAPAELDRTAVSPTGYLLVTDWVARNPGVANGHRRALAKAVDELLAQRADPALIPAALDEAHAERFHTPVKALPLAYDDVRRAAQRARAPRRAQPENANDARIREFLRGSLADPQAAIEEAT